MTTATPQDSPHRKVLLGALSRDVVDAIDGRIMELSAEYAAELIAPVIAQLTRLLEAQRANVATVNKTADMPPQVKQEVQATSEKAREAAAATDAVIDKVNAGQTVAPADVEQAAAKVDEADEAVKETSRTLESRLANLEKMSAPREGSDRANRFEDIEDDVTGLVARVDQLEACQGDLQVVSASAFAFARAATEPWARAGQAAIITYVLSFVLYMFMVAVSSLSWDWNWAIGLPAIIAGIVGALVFWRSNEGPGNEATAAAQIIVNRWAEREGNDDVSRSLVLADEEEAAQLTRVGRTVASARARVRTR